MDEQRPWNESLASKLWGVSCRDGNSCKAHLSLHKHTHTTSLETYSVTSSSARFAATVAVSAPHFRYPRRRDPKMCWLRLERGVTSVLSSARAQQGRIELKERESQLQLGEWHFLQPLDTLEARGFTCPTCQSVSYATRRSRPPHKEGKKGQTPSMPIHSATAQPQILSLMRNALHRPALTTRNCRTEESMLHKAAIEDSHQAAPDDTELPLK
eukprot:6398547-Amphidinium_carterae.1